MAISWELVVLFTALFIGIVTLSCLGVFGIVEERDRRGRIAGIFLILLSYALFMAMFYCLASGCLI